MDLVVLRRLLGELSETLVGRRIDQIYAVPRHHVVLVIGARSAPRLWFSAEPGEPHLYLRPGGHESPQRPPAFAMAARKWLRGQRLRELSLVEDDRVVAVHAGEPGARIVYELVPRRACAYLVLPDGSVGAVWNPRRGRPEPGAAYTPPERRPRTPLEDVDEQTWRRLEAADDERTLITGLLRNVAGMSGLVAREIAARRGEGPVRELTREELRRADEAPTEPRVYAPDTPERLSTSPAPRQLLLAPYPLRQADGLETAPFPGMVSAAAAYYGLRARLRLVDGVRDALSGAVRSRTASLQRARRRIEEDGGEPGAADALRRRADLLLACPDATVEDGVVTVPDVHGSGDPVEVPVDPSRSLVDNAQRYYRKARRADRRLSHDRARLEKIDAELARLDDLARATGDLAMPGDCDRLLRRARSLGLELDDRRLDEPEASAELVEVDLSPPSRDRGSAGPPAGIRRFHTPGGEEILVGRSARGNDRLTHRVAARHDWWLHAEGPGSHVVLRNPRRDQEPSEGPLLLAAALAAWFSKARESTKAEVRWTRVRDVKRPRGGAPGLALLERHQSVLVEPAGPEELGLTEDT